MNLKDSQNPVVQLARLAPRIQRRIGSGASANKQLLCWKTALDFYLAEQGSATVDRTA